MTHNDIITKFLIEYDKADVTSSYPSLTTYEIATILDKAYLALIGQKVTGNNVRRSGFETDIKAISDLQSLIGRETLRSLGQDYNANVYNLPDDFLYFISLRTFIKDRYLIGDKKTRIDHEDWSTNQFAKLVDHATAEKFMTTTTNIPWVKTPVCYIDSNQIVVISDPFLMSDRWKGKDQNLDPLVENEAFIMYIKTPKPFAIKDENNKPAVDITSQFELNSQMAEELISLAVALALENVESTRLNSKLNTRGLEA